MRDSKDQRTLLIPIPHRASSEIMHLTGIIGFQGCLTPKRACEPLKFVSNVLVFVGRKSIASTIFPEGVLEPKDALKPTFCEFIV
jgi:hypothetical protein